MRKSLIKSGYFVGLHVAILIMLIEFDVPSRVRNGLVSNDSAHLQSSPYKRALRLHQRMDGSVPVGSVLFVGDSMVEALVTSAVIDPSVNYGVGGDTTEGVLNRLSLYQSMNEARAVVLVVGINDLKLGVPHSETLANFRSILDSASARTQVLVGALHPVDETVIKHRIANREIVRLNAELAKLTDIHENTEFVDSSALLTDSDGQLMSQYHVGDGLHLSSQGYSIWIEQLKVSLMQMGLPARAIAAE